MSGFRKCLLRCVKTGREILLDHSKEIIIGRGPITEIVDPKVSRNQVCLEADIANCNIKIKCLGSNPCGINNKTVKKNETKFLHHGDQLELLSGKHIYMVEFVPAPSVTSDCKIVPNGNQLPGFKRERRDCDEEQIKTPSKKPKTDGDAFTNTSTIIVSKSETMCKKSMWETIDCGKLLVFTKEGLINKTKVAAFDLDGTIIKTKSGKVFPQHCDDWTLLNSAVQPTLSKLILDDYKVVIFTNQAGISRGKTNASEFKQKIENICDILKIPLQVFVATSDDIYRKPAPGMWDALIQKHDGATIDLKKSFYVGDAAGRIQNWMPKKKKDFSSADRLFAINIGLKFHTPEAHFLKETEGKYQLPEFNPNDFNCNSPLADADITSSKKEVVIMVGSPGSGKSFFVTTHLVPSGYVHVNRDTLGTWQKCVTVLENALAQNKSVVVDNTNPDKVSRKRFIDVAKRLKIPCRCFVLNSSIAHAIHNNKFRLIVKDEHIQVNEMMIYSYKKKLELPEKEEGFSEIVKINFVPKFTDPKRERLYKMYLV